MVVAGVDKEEGREGGREREREEANEDGGRRWWYVSCSIKPVADRNVPDGTDPAK